MKRDKRARFVLVTAFLSALLVPPAGTGQTQAPPSAAEIVTDYLNQDIFLRPGVGLKQVSLGMPFEQVLQTWGKPTRTDRHNLIDKKWVYEFANHTRIAVIGGDNVEAMRVQGGLDSPYVTTEGASFGMPKHQLITIYGAVNAESDKVIYNERGVGFVLKWGQISEIRIFPPD